MINNIQNISSHTQKYIHDFMCNCTIEEKIDTHYITVEIISKNEIQIKKANGDEINRVDLILNSMWNNLFLDWNYLKLSNKEWFALHIGYSIKMFYFPCDKPLLTLYDSNIRYIFDRVIFNNNDLDPKEILSDIKFPDAYNIDYKCLQNKIDNPDLIYNKHIKEILSKENNITEVFRMLINSNSKLFAKDEPEGYIYKYNNKIYQDVNNNRIINREKSSYEFLLVDFIKYCKNHNYIDKINQSYIKTICNLFNDYIVNNEKVNHTIEKNIDIESIENPNLGQKFEIGFEYIPDQVTKTLCKESELYKNIFKVLLANLRKGKDFKHCILLNKKQVDDWNTIMKNIKIRNIYI